jgi:integrase
VRWRIAPYLGHIPLQRLDELTIQEAHSKLETKGYEPSTIVETHDLLDAALTQAVTWRLLMRNPADGVITPSVRTPTPTVWTANEAATLLADADRDGSRHAPVWRLGLDSGMRLGEMLALSWQDVAFERGTVSVHRTLTRTGDGGWHIGDHPKTSTSRRLIIIASATLKALRRHKASQSERRLAAGASWQDFDLVFDRGDGRWFNPSTIHVHLRPRASELAYHG